MITVGLTGGIASGKSTVARMLEEKGARVLDADKIAHQVIEPGKPAWQEIVSWLGRDVLDPVERIDREKLGSMIFADPEARKKLNSIVHPRVSEEMKNRTARILEFKPSAVIVYDIPLLIEGGMYRDMDVVLLVYVSRQIQKKRLMERDSLSEAEAENRLQSQMALHEKRKYADYTVENESELWYTQKQVEEFWKQFIGKENHGQA